MKPPYNNYMFRLAVPLAYIRRSPKATRLFRLAFRGLFVALDARNSYADRRLPR